MAALLQASSAQDSSVQVSPGQEPIPNPFEPLTKSLAPLKEDPSSSTKQESDSASSVDETALGKRQLPASDSLPQEKPPVEQKPPTDFENPPLENLAPVQAPATDQQPKDARNKKRDEQSKVAQQPGAVQQPGVAGKDQAEVLLGQANSEPDVIAPREDLLQGQFKRPYLIELDFPIDSFFSTYFRRSVEKAKSAEADLIIIKLTTPGGELPTTVELARFIAGIEWAKVVFWIPDQAISGGAILSLSGDAIYMKSSATFGDAGPIYMMDNGDMIHAEEKVVSYTAEAVRQIARDSGRPQEVAAAMADRKLKVFIAIEKQTGREVFLNEAQSRVPANVVRFNIGDAIEEAGNDRFLTVSGKRARQLHLCDELVESESELLSKLSSVTPVRLKADWKDHLAFILNLHSVTALLLIVAVVCLYFEFTIPGATIPGLISLVCFGAFFWSHILSGTAGGLEIMLFLVGAVCLIFEIFVLPGFGVFGIAGLGLIGLSLLMATQDFIIPQTRQQWSEMEGNGLTIAIVGIVVVGLIALQLFWLDSIPGLKRFQLQPEVVVAASTAAVEMHPAASMNVGDRGITHSDLRPSGKALIAGQLLDVLSEGDYVEQGTPVNIVRIEGNIITVRRCET